MSQSKLHRLFGILLATLCIVAIPLQSQAAPKSKITKAVQPTKERLVLMPLRVPDEDKNLTGAMETALVKGLQQKYDVFSGERVAQKAHEIFLKESRNNAHTECDETKCMQNIAEAFQAELIAASNVTKQNGTYFLALSIQNIFDNKVVYSESIPCEGCNAAQVVDKLKELSGSSIEENTDTSEDSSKSTQGRSKQELLIESKGLIEFEPENNEVKRVPPEEKRFAEELIPIMKLIGDLTDVAKNKEAIAGINKILATHPEWADGFFLRATLSLAAGEKDYSKLISDVDTAIKLHPAMKSKTAFESEAEMYHFRSKLDLLIGNNQQAMDDLEIALKFDPNNPAKVLNTGGVKPDDNSNPMALHSADFAKLVSLFPTDYRSYLYRGLFYYSFSNFDFKFNYDPVFQDLNKALTLNPKSAMVNYFIGNVYNSMVYRSQDKQAIREKAHTYFMETIKLEPEFPKASLKIANELYDLERYAEAIPYFDTAIKLNPSYYGTYHDRGLAKMNTNDLSGAEEDISKSIELMKGDDWGFLEMAYENLALVHVKQNEFEKAVKDNSKLIGVNISKAAILMAITDIRKMYPEFDDISDEDLREGLRRKYYPEVKFKKVTDFLPDSKKKKEPYINFELIRGILARGDAILGGGNWKGAAKEYSRVLPVDPKYIPFDRWKSVKASDNFEYLIDFQTFSPKRGSTNSFWVRKVDTSTQYFSQSKYHINCAKKSISISLAKNYDADGRVLGAGKNKQVSGIEPDSIEEFFYNGACGISQKY